jgi:hypothetical protein
MLRVNGGEVNDVQIKMMFRSGRDVTMTINPGIKRANQTASSNNVFFERGKDRRPLEDPSW